MDPSRQILWLTGQEGPYLSKHQLTGLEEKQNFAGVYEKRITYFLYHQGQKKNPSPDYLRS